MSQSVSDYAGEVGISERRVRKLAESRQIAATKVGHSWIIHEPVLRHQLRRSEGGRPLSEQSAWDLALMLDGYASISSRPSRTRARISQLRNEPRLRNGLGAWLAGRSEPKHYRLQPADLGGFRDDPHLFATGVSHPESGLLQAAEHEAYVLSRDLGDVVDDYLLVVSTPDRANVTLRVIDGPVGLCKVPRLLIAADLMDRGAAREVAAAHSILDKIL